MPYENSMDAKYEELINSQARWFTDGHIDKQKNIQLSLSSQLPLTNEMTFILVFTMYVIGRGKENSPQNIREY